MLKKHKLAIVLSSVLFVSAAYAADPSYELNIGAQSMSEALKTLADQSGLEIVYEASLVAGRSSPQLKGKMTAEEAVGRLLAGSGLEYRALNARAITITRVGSKTPGTSGDEGQSGRPKPTGGAEHDDRPEPIRQGIKPSASEQPKDLDAVVVTGSHIRGVGETGSPILVLSREKIAATGYSTVQDILRTITATAGGGPSDIVQNGTEQGSNFNAGGSVNLRGLGAGSTLVLINGKRQAGGGLDGRFVDVSSIPSSAIDRIEVLTDGASAIYGSDAVGGVVNIILRSDFEGSESQVRVGSVSGGADDYLFGQLFGKYWGSGNAMLAYQYSKRQSLKNEARPYSASTDKRPFGGTDQRSYYSNPGNILDPATGLPAYAIPRGQNGMSLEPDDLIAGSMNLHSTAEGEDLLPEQEMHSLLASATQKLGDRVTLKGDLRYTDRDMTRYFAAQPVFLVVPSTNAFFVDPFGGSSSIFVAYNWDQDTGPRPTFSNTKTLAGSIGATIELDGGWSLDAYGSYGQDKIDWESHGAIHPADIAPYLASSDPAVAFNPFGDGSFNDRELLRSLGTSQYEYSRSRTWSANVTAQGPLFQVPAGPVQLAVGADYRDEMTDRNSYLLRPSGARTGVANPVPGRRDVTSIFAETQIPIFGKDNERPGLHQLNLSLAGRYEDYSDFGSTFNPKVGLSWYPAEPVQIRASYGTSFRAPNLMDSDVGNPLNRLIAEVANVVDPTSPSGRSNIIALWGNSGNLKEETATTWTAGFDIKPRSLPGFAFSWTYFNVEYKDRIERGGPVTGPYEIFGEEERWGPIITRNPTREQLDAICQNPAIRFGNGSAADCYRTPAPTIVDMRVRNMSTVTLDGFDLSMTQSWDTNSGSWTASLEGTYLRSWKQEVSSTSEPVDLIDTLNGPLSRKVRAGLSWSSDKYFAGMFANYANSYTDHRSTPERRINSNTTLDLRLGYRPGGIVDSTEYSVGVINAFDRAPPFVNTPEGFDVANASPIGRAVNLQVTKSW